MEARSAFRCTLIVLAALAAAACGQDPAAPRPAPTPVHRFAPLSNRSDVLKNLELAYNRRRIDKIDDLLDSHFVFFLSASDFGLGYPEKWNRASELKYTSMLFDPNNGIFNFSSLVFHLHLEASPVWESIASPDSLPGETWYRTAVDYDFRFEMDNGYVYYNSGAPAIFIVRNAGTTNAPRWQLVYLRDLAGSCFFASADRLSTIAHPCPEHSWGAMKALFWLPCAPNCAPP
jgi:hypothetical protein